MSKQKKYKLKEIYYTLQGEGFHSGRPALFVRFSGCNLWSGREEDREKAICSFCDTDFRGTDGQNGGKYTATELVSKLKKLWPSGENSNRFVVCTGGEPLLQLDEELIAAIHAAGYELAVETNGTIAAPATIDWICVSPKANAGMVQRSGDELKVVYPQKSIDPKDFEGLDFKHFYLQPMESEDWDANTSKTVEYCKSRPKWKLSLQTHKYLNIP